MLRCLPCVALLACLFTPGVANAQNSAVQATQSSDAAAKSSPKQPAAETPVLHAGTQLVLVDVTVRDRAGRPVSDLTRDEFTVLDEGKPASLRSFDEFSAGKPAPEGPPAPVFPPGTYSDYEPVQSGGGPLYVLLVDSLNTPLSAQSYLHEQLKRYLDHATPGTRIAIFGLTSRLILLQGFTSDPAVLRRAVDGKLTPRQSNLRPSNDETNAEQGATDTQLSNSPVNINTSNALAASRLKMFEANEQSFQTQLRVQYTVQAFEALGQYLEAFPGRKNLIWFSGSFPINILPDPSLQNAFYAMRSMDQDFQRMTNLLARAQTAVYPVDARGLTTQANIDPSLSGQQYASSLSTGATANQNTGFGRTGANAVLQDVATDSAALAAEQGTMEDLAKNTGGHAFYGANDLAAAVTNAIKLGANYYTLAYTPPVHANNGAFHRISVQLNGAAAQKGYSLSYRRGYFAEGPGNSYDPAAAAPAAAKQPLQYLSAAMSHGGPTPSGLLLKVRVLPAPPTRETKEQAAPGNILPQSSPLKPPFQRFVVDFVAFPQQFELSQGADGRRDGRAEFLAYVFDDDGHVLNFVSRTLRLQLTEDTYASMTHNGLRCRVELSAPAQSASWLRLAVHDPTSHKLGVVEIPTSEVSHLTPLTDDPTASPAAPNSSGQTLVRRPPAS